ncbi:RING-H2 finger protein ATL39-like [Prunus yedoensis var. nudiflora]|uniref:RING-type E3 ubiquitin transferase n=1 Tax=Prunus yedoensis var. nudiflora TaxID=2094558 RepID=A0A314YYW8_PRUYE|nr:RING-H2 finger protein ATL39-like [Prunus yedoensis var. nudiflora]
MSPPLPSPATPPHPLWIDYLFVLFFPPLLTCFIFGSLYICCLCLVRIPIDDVEHKEIIHNSLTLLLTIILTKPLLQKHHRRRTEKKASSFRYTKNQAIATNTDSECSICLGEFKDWEKCRQLECEHAFHEECIDQWLRKKIQCPLCRATVSSVQLKQGKRH